MASTGGRAEDFCLACFNGDYPIAIPEVARKGKLRLESAGKPAGESAQEHAE